MQVLVQAGQTIKVDGGAAWVGVPEGTLIIIPTDGAIQVVPANEFNLVPVTPSTTPPAPSPNPAPVATQVSPTSPVTVAVMSPAK
jgi:hypothetical protein